MNEIVTTTNENNVPVDVDYAIEEWRAYQRLTRELLDETDYQTHRGRKYKFSCLDNANKGYRQNYYVVCPA